jgi:transcriptional regulator with XRE-family HTH domain
VSGIRVQAVADVRAVMASVGERRRALGLLQRQVAAMTEIHCDTYAQYETGSLFPPSREMARILRAVGLRLTTAEVA